MPTSDSARTTSFLLAAAFLGTALAVAPFARGFFGTDEIAAAGLVTALVTWLVAGVLTRPRAPVRLEVSPLLVAIAAFTVWTAVCAWLSPARGASADATLQTSLLALAALGVLAAPNREFALRGALGATIVISLAWALIGDYQFLVLLQPPIAYFLNQNSYAAFLNLALLGAAGALLGLDSSSNRALRAALLITVVVLGLSIGASSSRGALLGDLVGIAVLATGAWRARRRRRGAVLAAALLALVVLGGELSTLRSPAPSGAPLAAAGERIDLRPQPLAQRLGAKAVAAIADRAIIWRGAWALVEDAPWHGVGPGLFWLAFPKYRVPIDASAGFHAHDDYLEFAAELGIPGAILFLAIAGCAAAAWWRATRGEPGDALRASGMAAGLAATFAQSGVDFNFFIVPILIVAGVFMAGLHALGHRARPYPVVALPAAADRTRGAIGVRSLLAAAPLVAVGFSATAAFAAYHYDSALVLAAAGRAQEAAAELGRSLAVRSRFEAVHLAYADLDLSLLRAGASATPEARVAVATHALNLLARADKLNPLRSDVPYLGGMIQLVSARDAGPRALADARSSFELALRRDPRNIDARLALVQLLGAGGDVVGAFRESEAGVDLFYPFGDQFLRYMAIAAELRIRNGDVTGAEALARRADDVLTSRRRPAMVLDAMRSAHPDLATPGN